MGDYTFGTGRPREGEDWFDIGRTEKPRKQPLNIAPPLDVYAQVAAKLVNFTVSEEPDGTGRLWIGAGNEVVILDVQGVHTATGDPLAQVIRSLVADAYRSAFGLAPEMLMLAQLAQRLVESRQIPDSDVLAHENRHWRLVQPPVFVRDLFVAATQVHGAVLDDDEQAMMVASARIVGLLFMLLDLYNAVDALGMLNAWLDATPPADAPG